MAKRRRTPQKKFFSWQTFEENRHHFAKLFWLVVITICLLFGFSRARPLVADGQVLDGILIGLAYGGGAFIVISISYFLNRKLKGL